MIIHGIKIENAITTGNMLHQIAAINWSYLNLGNEALIQIKINNNIEVLNPNDKPVINPLDSTPGIK